jgi:hypothetical protein
MKVNRYISPVIHQGCYDKMIEIFFMLIYPYYFLVVLYNKMAAPVSQQLEQAVNDFCEAQGGVAAAAAADVGAGANVGGNSDALLTDAYGGSPLTSESLNIRTSDLLTSSDNAVMSDTFNNLTSNTSVSPSGLNVNDLSATSSFMPNNLSLTSTDMPNNLSLTSSELAPASPVQYHTPTNYKGSVEATMATGFDLAKFQSGIKELIMQSRREKAGRM